VCFCFVTFAIFWEIIIWYDFNHKSRVGLQLFVRHVLLGRLLGLSLLMMMLFFYFFFLKSYILPLPCLVVVMYMKLQCIKCITDRLLLHNSCLSSLSKTNLSPHPSGSYYQWNYPHIYHYCHHHLLSQTSIPKHVFIILVETPLKSLYYFFSHTPRM